MHILYIYACMQIIFESLPVSSSGNLALWIPMLHERFFSHESLNNLTVFDYALHIPTFFILALFLFLYFFSFFKAYKNRIITLIVHCFVSNLITVLLYFFWNFIGKTFFPLWFGFLITTFFLFSLRFVKKTILKKELTCKDACLLGLVQGVALLPGISRFAATFVAAVWLGYEDTKAFLYSFILELPLIAASGMYASIRFYENALPAVVYEKHFYMLIVASSMLSFCVLMSVFATVKRKTFWKYGLYTLFLAIVAFYYR